MKTTPHFQPGSRGCPVAFVFSCPGRHEERRGRPVSGPSGARLDAALPALQAAREDLFPYPLRISYRITNAWPRVEYPAKTGRTEATAAEISRPANLRRLARELKGPRLVVACGRSAAYGVSLLGDRLPAARVRVPHLSPRVFRGRGTADWLAAWTKDLVRQLPKPEKVPS